ncbi:MAG: hypothetical protein GC180_08190 [Bacteroidetes bacterium]|nr:hypothetical protein [Bacteroidota bacterium]
MKQAFVLIFVTLLIGTFACRKKEIADPSYIHVNKPIQLSHPGQGTALNDIRYVYTLINDNSIGTYPAPTTFPVLYQGDYTVEARPMIKWLARDGFHPYSMMKNYAQFMHLNTLAVDTLRPVFEYEDNVEFVWLEDFDDNDASVQISSGSFDTFYMKNDPDIRIEGNYLEINMGNGQQFFTIETKDLFVLPTDGREVILELDYNTNVPFIIGVTSVTSSQVNYLSSVTPYDTEKNWVKGYVYLTDEVFNLGKDVKFRVFFRSANAEIIDPVIRLDNLKLLYRKG